MYPEKRLSAGVAVLGLLAGACAIASLPGSAAANLLVNPGFEDNDPTMETDEVIGWNDFAASYVNQALPRTGVNAFKTFGNASGVYQDTPASEGDMFQASVWAANPSFDALGDDQGAFVNIEWIDSGGNQISFVSQPVILGFSTPADDTYVFGTIVGTAPAGTTAARMTLITGAFFDADADGTVEAGGAPYFDDAVFVEVIPEPAGAGLLLGGLLVLARRR